MGSIAQSLKCLSIHIQGCEFDLQNMHRKDSHDDSTPVLINSQWLGLLTQDLHTIKPVNILARRGEGLMRP